MILKLFLILLYVAGLSAKKIILVSDTTISMKEELVYIKRSGRAFLNTLRSSGFDEFILLPFGSSDHTEPIVTKNVDSFSSYLNRLTAWGGGNECPENSLAAIHKAMDISDEGSYVFMFTDASSKPYDIEGIKRMCQAKKSRVVIFLTGYCLDTDSHPTGHVEEYSDVTSACAGAFYRMDPSYIQEAFNIIKETIKGEWTDIFTKKGFSELYTEVQVSSSTSDLVISVSGDDPSVDLTHEDGSQPALDRIVDAGYSPSASQPRIKTQLYRVRGFHTGMYTAEVTSRGDVTLAVFARKDFPFNYGFSTRPPRSMKETSRRPMPGRDARLLIEIPKGFNVKLEHAELLAEDGDRTILSLTKTSEEPHLYLSNSFKVDKGFKLSIYGRDTNTYKEFIETTAMLEPQNLSGIKTESRPNIEMLETGSTLVNAGDPVTLACKVTGYPEPAMTWRDDEMVSYTPENVFLEIPSVHISYLTVSNISRNNTFYCKAENRNGYSEAKNQVFVKKNYYIEEIQVPEDQTIKFGSEATLSCSVKSVPEASIRWYYNDTSISFSDRLEVSNPPGTLKIKSMGLEDVGKYDCEAATAYETKRFTAFVDISGLEPPKIESVSVDSFMWNIGSSEELQCGISKGIPTPQISWQFKSEGDANFGSVNWDLSSSGTKLVFREVKQHHKGTFKCIASNVQGNDYKEFSVQIRLPPNILNEKDEHIDVTESNTVELPCAVDGEPSVHWQYKGRGGRIALDNRHSVDYEHTLRFRATERDAGDYFCVAKNDVGEDERVVHVNVLVAPYIVRPDLPSLKVRSGASVTLPCRVLKGNPTPAVHWEHARDDDGPTERIPGMTSDLVLRRVTSEDAGIYTCFARNTVWTDTFKIHLTVL